MTEHRSECTSVVGPDYLMEFQKSTFNGGALELLKRLFGISTDIEIPVCSVRSHAVDLNDISTQPIPSCDPLRHWQSSYKVDLNGTCTQLIQWNNRSQTLKDQMLLISMM
jgi:hypothetical protein